jgi:bacterioferritin-associated ferredoxin
MNRYIELKGITLQDKKIIFDFRSNLPIFYSDRFYVEYDKGLPAYRESIACIPFVASMVTIGWFYGADIIAPSLDLDYAEALGKIKDFYKKLYPKWHFESEVKAKREKNIFNTHKCGLLFTAGIDSLASYVRSKDKKPVLYSVLGAGIRLNNSGHWDSFKNNIDKFRAQEGIEHVFIKTNLIDIVDTKEMDYYFKGRWWPSVSHSLILTALTAPVSYEYLKTLFIASSFWQGTNIEWGSGKVQDELISWGGTSVFHDGFDLTRERKIREIVKSSPEIHKFIKVCDEYSGKINCSQCGKCLRTMVSLLQNNIDPKHCNFDINSETLRKLKRRLKYDIFFSAFLATHVFWRDMQNNTDYNSLDNQYGQREFIKWFLSFKVRRNTFIILLIKLRYFLKHNKYCTKPAFLLEYGYSLALRILKAK